MGIAHHFFLHFTLYYQQLQLSTKTQSSIICKSLANKSGLICISTLPSSQSIIIISRTCWSSLEFSLPAQNHSKQWLSDSVLRSLFFTRQEQQPSEVASFTTATAREISLVPTPP